MTNKPQFGTTIRLLTHSEIPAIVHAFADAGWHKPASTFESYLLEQEKNERIVWLAFQQNIFAGYVTLKWCSAYPHFNQKNIPEINDLNVLPQFRRQGIASKLLDIAEEKAKQTHSTIGLGVGLYADYGSAQRLYIKRRYIPDGKGITYQYELVPPGNLIRVDDDLVLWFVKSFE